MGKDDDLRTRLEVIVVSRCETPLLKEHDTVFTAFSGRMAAYHLIKFPTRPVPVFIGKAFVVHLILAICDFPAGSIVKEFLDSLDADLLFVY